VAGYPWTLPLFYCGFDFVCTFIPSYTLDVRMRNPLLMAVIASVHCSLTQRNLTHINKSHDTQAISSK
jgi:hypothetical protein